jgi:hypothetical protein
MEFNLNMSSPPPPNWYKLLEVSRALYSKLEAGFIPFPYNTPPSTTIELFLPMGYDDKKLNSASMFEWP